MDTLLKEKQETNSLSSQSKALSLLELLDIEATFTPPQPFSESFTHSLKALHLSITNSTAELCTSSFDRLRLLIS